MSYPYTDEKLARVRSSIRSHPEGVVARVIAEEVGCVHGVASRYAKLLVDFGLVYCTTGYSGIAIEYYPKGDRC